MASELGSFAYSPLYTNEIRLLILLPGASNDQVYCRLVNTTLISSGPLEQPIYDALSYVWGPVHPTAMIWVNNCPFPIRQNLFAALKALRDHQFPRCLWVDAICINQTSNSERSSQVSIMSQIFRAATKVFVWLGEASHDSNMLFDILAKVEGRLSLLDSMIRIWSRAGLDVTNYTKTRIQKAFLEICRRPYWTRLWIIQEILSASSIDLLCGSKQLRWEFFSAGLKAIGNIGLFSTLNQVESCAWTPAYPIAAKYSYHSKDYAMEDLVSLCELCDSQCEDIRDRIYGLVSLANDFQITADYSKSPLQLYIEIFRIFYFTPQKGGLQIENNTAYSETEFIDTIRRLLDDPTWDAAKSRFFALQEYHFKPANDDFELTSRDVMIYYPYRIQKVSSVISTATAANSSSFFQHDTYVTEHNISVTTKELINSIQSLGVRDFQRTTVIGDLYCIDGDLAGPSNCYKASTTNIVETSDDLYRLFSTSQGLYGLASYFIEESDLLCYIDGLKNYFIVRLKPKDSSFIIIGQAVVFWDGDRLMGYHESYTNPGMSVNRF